MDAKQVLVVRTKYKTEKGELSPRRGKIMAQSAHGSMQWLAERFAANIPWYSRWGVLSHLQKEWLCGKMTKVCVYVKTEEELREIYEKAKAAGLESHLVIDSGKTEFDGPEPTCCAIGPNESDRIDEITKHLPLY